MVAFPRRSETTLGVDPGAQRQGGVRVAQVIQADLWEPRSLHGRAEEAAHDLGAPGLAILLGEHEAGVGPGVALLRLIRELLGRLTLERLRGLRVEGHRPASPRRLRLGDDYDGTVGNQGAAHREPAW